MEKIKTNEDLVKNLMNYSRFGALSQMVVMQALAEGIDRIVSNKDAYIKKQEEEEKEGLISFINHKAYVSCAEDIQKRIIDFYKKEINKIN